MLNNTIEFENLNKLMLDPNVTFKPLNCITGLKEMIDLYKNNISDIEGEDRERWLKGLYNSLPVNLIYQLGQLVKGPIWAGDLESKEATYSLMHLGLCFGVMVKEEEGHYAVSWLANSILKAYKY